MSIFKNAEQYENELKQEKKKKPYAWKREHKDTIRELWKKIGFITVYCPHCNTHQKCQTIEQHTCINCEKAFKIMPERQPSRIIEAPKGTIPLIRNVHSLTKYKKFCY